MQLYTIIMPLLTISLHNTVQYLQFTGKDIVISYLNLWSNSLCNM